MSENRELVPTEDLQSTEMIEVVPGPPRPAGEHPPHADATLQPAARTTSTQEHRIADRSDTQSADAGHEPVTHEPHEPHRSVSERDDGSLHSNHGGMIPSYSNMSMVSVTEGLPIHLRHLAHELRYLPNEDFMTLADITRYISAKDVFSTLNYRGEAWYLPQMEEVAEGEPQWEIYYARSTGLVVTVGSAVPHCSPTPSETRRRERCCLRRGWGTRGWIRFECG